jgi:hypothetical protein
MELPIEANRQVELELAPSPAGNLPGTAHTGLILLEYAGHERKSGEDWVAVNSDLPVTFQAVQTEGRLRLETWTHKPLFSVWLPPSVSILDGDRLIRSDGSRWYVRGAPLVSPSRTHVVALVEAAAEDGLFAARSASEPA